VVTAIARFFGGTAPSYVSVRNLLDPNIMVQLGVAPVRVDLLPRLVTVPFAKAWKRRVRAKFGKTPANFLGLADLVAEKRHFARAQDIADLEQLPTRLSFRVICGTTGSGKSRLLQQLAAIGAQVLDLEALAHHRGSVLGGLPALPQPSQKHFETRLWWALRGFDTARAVYVESESRKVGELRVPDRLLATMRASDCIRLEVPLAARIRLLRDEYAHFEANVESLRTQLDCLAPLHGNEKIAQWKRLAGAAGWDELVERLLVEHYDPAYLKSIDRNFERVGQARVLRIQSDDRADFLDAARELAGRTAAS
jgi:tRNA 2-selenouridine synthase